ncbi:Alpha/beta hydrolase family protein [Reichenbachiella faecimaris]|uniref:Alpha/beta hydrolase family protein n=1 Tax=Reichenbachiella faecimaris TaxID=692418 RepID=A0A1W2G669_REIFA|nr:alpha/beta hydrolase [Reichenbachiella faecimaris]SMD31942.1 Alpha/beta hydrolase family protein [Reichenbachiella faecimaris]
MRVLFLIFSLLISFYVEAYETIKIKASDGVEVTVDLHISHPDTVPFVVLFHQAGWSRGEYQEIAPMLNQLGFNCMTVDQRSGNAVNGVQNLTFVSARKLMKETKYVNALPDMNAAIDHAKSYLAKGDLIIWGSSYSSALALKIAGDRPGDVSGVLAFSPGEYFQSMGKPKNYITTSAMNIKCPSFITSARSEKNSWWSIYEAIPTDSKTYYLPKTSGNHGSKALWSKFTDSQGYWEVVIAFLNQYL